MDIEYLLFLQSVRDSMGSFFPNFMEAVSEIAVSEIPVLLICFVYWALDRRAGKRIIGGYSLGLFMNGLLKLTFCVYRPWIRDARVLPYGDSKVTATGYSFPSGHSTRATATFGGVGEWLRQQERRVICALLWILVALIMFSRNFLGVHTPQDVIVGFASTVLSMFVIYKIEDWTDADPKRDFIVMAAGLALAVAAAIFFMVKPYPLDYTADGSLLVDPMKMANDSFQGIGFIAGYVICRAIERRGFDFDKKLVMRDRLVCAVVGLVPLYLVLNLGPDFLKALIGAAGKNVVIYFFITFYAMVVMPAVMSLVAKYQNR